MNDARSTIDSENSVVRFPQAIFTAGQCTILAIFFTFLCALPGLAQPRNALTLNDISDLIKNGVRPNRIAQIVEERGVGFELDDRALRRLNQDGANETVLAAVKKMSARYSEERQQARGQQEETRRKQVEEAKRREVQRRQQARQQQEPRARHEEARPGKDAQEEAKQREAERPMPVFPWPPPRASAETMIPHKWLPPRGKAQLIDVADRLENALKAAKYPRWSYSSVEEGSGFALVSHMEQIKADGTPSPDPARWSTRLPAVTNLTLLEFIKALANAQTGYYRVIVFVVANKPWQRKPETPTGVEAKKWFDDGFSWLPPSIAELPYGSDYRTTALVFEFKKVSQNTAATFLDPSATSADDHLRKAGISDPLSH